MRKTFITAFVIAAIALTGCSTADTLAKGVSEKSISASGAFVHSRAGLNTTTQTPEASMLFIWGDYASVVPGDEVFRYEEQEDASIFNAEAKSSKKKVFFATGDKDRMDAVIKAITQGGNNAGQSD
jgi:hypothetical protein